MNDNQPAKAEVLNQLSEILRSQIFRNSEMLRNFLSFVVQEALKKDGMVLKQYSIAIHAFGRHVDFDATSDPIVRIQASRLRRNLEQYFSDEGKNDPVLIILSKGSYTPKFKYRNKTEAVSAKVKTNDKLTHSLAVFPIKNLSENKEKQYILDGFNEELLLELSRYKDLDVIRVDETLNDAAKISFAGFALEGSMRFDRDTIKISFHVRDNIKNQIFWSFQDKINLEKYNLIDIQEKVATSVAQQIAGISGVIFEKLFNESNWHDEHDPEVYTAYMHFYAYNKNPTEKNANELLEKVTKLVKNKPAFAPGWAVLCNLYTDAYMFGLDRSNLEQGLKFGSKSVELQPNNQVCQAYYGYALMIADQLEKARKHFDISCELNPNSPYYIGAIGWAYSMMDRVDEGFDLIRRSMKIDFHYPKWLHIGTFIYYLQHKDYDKALIEANQVDRPELYWSHLVKLVANEKLSLFRQATIHLNDLMEVKPDFFDRPLDFIRALIKSKTISKEIYQSLQSVMQTSKMIIPEA